MASYTTKLNLKKPAGSENVAIGDINNNMDIIDNAFSNIDYFTLLNAEEITPTLRTVNLYNGRNMDDYKYVLAVVRRGSYYRASMLLPTPLFSASGNFSLTEVDSVNTQRWYEVKFVSSTSVEIQASSNVSDAEVRLYGINKMN